MTLPFQIQVWLAFTAVRDRIDRAAATLREERGELTGSVIFLVALAVAAAAVGAIVVAKINSHANNIP